MSDIILTTLNAKYIHSSFGLRYLKANLGPLESRCTLMEYTIQHRPLDIVQELLAQDPQIIGMGIYIWNATQSLSVVRLLKKVRPEIAIVLGGPEVSYEHQQQELCELADHVISGEGEVAFRELCTTLLEGKGQPKPLIFASPPDVNALTLPYQLYSDADIANRVIYVEASRGCPFKCQFCLSALDQKVRTFPMDAFLGALKDLLDRGVRQFKFVDRTFNLAPKFTNAILSFFHDEYVPGLFLHFEMIPDRFPPMLKEWLSKFPVGCIQLEVGIQTFNPEVSARIERRQEVSRISENLSWLLEHQIHLHTDLIIGLPGESMESVAAGFDRLIALDVQEIQVGILKRLRGAPIIRHIEPFEMIFSPEPPYEILQSKDWTFEALTRMRRFARYWDMVGNSGRYGRTLKLLIDGPSAFMAFLQFADWLYAQTGKTHKISMERMLRFLFDYLDAHSDIAQAEIAGALAHDYCHSTQHRRPPQFLRAWVPEITLQQNQAHQLVPERQRRHLRGTPS